MFSASGLERYGKTVTNSKGGFNDQERPRSVVGIVASGDDITGGDWWVLLALLASINVFVALFNLLPLPPLDGGHAAVAIYEGIASKIRGRRVQRRLPEADAGGGGGRRGDPGVRPVDDLPRSPQPLTRLLAHHARRPRCRPAGRGSSR